MGSTRILPDPEEQPFVNVQQTATFLGISKHSTYDAIRSGAIPSIRVGTSIRIPTAELRRMAGLT